MSRQQRRKLERELLKLAGDLNRDGLPVPHRPEATMALALAVREELSDTKTAARASKAAALVERVFDLTMRKLPAGAAPAAARLRGRVHLLLPQHGDGDGARDFPGRARASRAP